MAEAQASSGVPWTEKYRPRLLSDVCGQKEIVERMKAYVKAGNVPHMLFAGPPGIGKTTVALALSRELYGEGYSSAFLELNASVTPETPVLIRWKGGIKRTTFGWLAGKFFCDGESKYAYPDGLEILSLDKDYKVHFMPVSNISRHKVGEVVRIRYEGGTIRTSTNHSVMVIDGEGNIVTKPAGRLEKGELLISFASELPGRKTVLQLGKHCPKALNLLKSGLVKNPKIQVQLEDTGLDNETSWMLGLYLAEGCALLLPRGTSGQTIFTVGRHEGDTANRVCRAMERFGVKTYRKFGASGFDRARLSSIQVRVFNTQLAKFFMENFYDGAIKRNATTKRVPEFIFEAGLGQRLQFLKGYMGDASGKWGGVLRFSSRSPACLVDTAWLGRVSGLNSSLFRGEARLIWKTPGFSYLKTELLPAEPFIKFLKRVAPSELHAHYLLRHSLYHKKSKRVTKGAIREFLLKHRRILDRDPVFHRLLRLLESPLSVVSVHEIGCQPYEDYVYDVSVPGAEVFWGGTTPILLHNSDERGIDVVRGKIKDFARTLSLNDVPFKIVFLDESDALTPDAQNALRRTMEMFAGNNRFILSCNYSSKIIEPIQSRCAVFRFKPLTEEEVGGMLCHVAGKEGVKVDAEGLKALFYVSEGDMRKAINALQGAAASAKVVTAEVVHKVSSRARPEEVRQMIECAVKGDFLGARERLDKVMLEYGMSGEDVLLQMYKEVTSLGIPDRQKVALVDRIGEYNFRLVEGANERIQLEALLAQIMLISEKG